MRKLHVDVKVSKLGATYVFVEDTDYRCIDCWKFKPESNQCAEMREEDDFIHANGYCVYWSPGDPDWDDLLECSGAYTAEELGYSENPNGTKCHRCVYFDLETGRRCRRVDESSPGDTPGIIHPNGCCANQEPRD